MFSGEYIWKYTHNGYDFSVLGNTPITFPIEWHNSKIPGYAGRVSVPNIHGFSALVVFSSVAARFFPPQIGGAGATCRPLPDFPSASTTTKSSTRRRTCNTSRGSVGPGSGFNWRYDSGLVAGNAPCYGLGPGQRLPAIDDAGGQPAVCLQDVFGNPLSADQEFEAGFTCNGVRATPTAPLPSPCLASQFGSTLIKVPAIGRRERRPQSAAHRVAEPVRRLGGARQPVPRRQVQSERATDGHQPDQQVRALQLSLDVQRHALCDAASADGGARVSLLAVGGQRHALGRRDVAGNVSPPPAST